jgi:hypothetical protein
VYDVLFTTWGTVAKPQAGNQPSVKGLTLHTPTIWPTSPWFPGNGLKNIRPRYLTSIEISVVKFFVNYCTRIFSIYLINLWSSVLRHWFLSTLRVYVYVGFYLLCFNFSNMAIKKNKNIVRL